MNVDLTGAWRLVSFALYDADGQCVYPYGQDARGYLIYSVDGCMSVAFMRAVRPNFASEDPTAGSLEEKARAADDYYGYCGTYEIRGDTVVHHCDVSFFPNWCGAEQVRQFRLEAGRLTLSTPPMPVSGSNQTAHLVWERVKPDLPDNQPLLAGWFMKPLDL